MEYKEEALRRRDSDLKHREEEFRQWEEDARRQWEEELRRSKERIRREEENPGTSGGTEEDASSLGDTSSDICDGGFDAVVESEGFLLLFKGENVWKYSSPGNPVSGSPLQLRLMFPGLPDDVNRVDAVMPDVINGGLILFAGKHYYRRGRKETDGGASGRLWDFGIDDHITALDAAFIWPKNNKTYFFRGDRYWRYDNEAQAVDTSYPHPLSRWNGLPRGLDAAFTWTDGLSYFFKDGDYWLYDNARVAPKEGYPRDAALHWAGC